MKPPSPKSLPCSLEQSSRKATFGGNTATSGFNLDDVQLSPPAGAQNGKVVISPALYDMQGVDVLRGPQGTSYGAGAMGGAVKSTTMPPNPAAFAGVGAKPARRSCEPVE